MRGCPIEAGYQVLRPDRLRPGDLLTFPNGLFGFEEEKQFLLLPFHGSLGSLVCFQSARTPALAFVAMNPFSLDPGYHPQLSEEELYLMGAKDYSELKVHPRPGHADYTASVRYKNANDIRGGGHFSALKRMKP